MNSSIHGSPQTCGVAEPDPMEALLIPREERSIYPLVLPWASLCLSKAYKCHFRFCQKSHFFLLRLIQRPTEAAGRCTWPLRGSEEPLDPIGVQLQSGSEGGSENCAFQHPVTELPPLGNVGLSVYCFMYIIMMMGKKLIPGQGHSLCVCTFSHWLCGFSHIY